jgi:L-ascorbate metabolism protein UlaG (beta-lactamase superfamily)
LRGVVLSGPLRNVQALDWDQKVSIPGKTHPLELHFLAVQHWSARWLGDRNTSLWGSWAVIHPDLRFWFSGDLGYSRDTQDIGARFGGFDWAAIGIGAYAPRWFMKKHHIDPQEALQVMRDVRAQAALGIHWGTFEGLSDEPLDQPPQDLARALRQAPDALKFFVVRPGQSCAQGSCPAQRVAQHQGRQQDHGHTDEPIEDLPSLGAGKPGRQVTGTEAQGTEPQHTGATGPGRE